MTNPAEQAITAHIGGLKCDTPTCNYRDDSINVGEYESYINAPCPKCGASLLTPEDFATVQHTMAIAEFINSLSPERLAKLSNVSPEEVSALTGLSTEELNRPGNATMTLELNGTGDVKMSISKEEGETK